MRQHGTEDFPIELYKINKEHTRFEMASHWHSHVEIIRVICGELNIKLYNNEYIASGGDVIFVNSETVHGAVPSQDCIYECIVLHTQMLSLKESSCNFFLEGILGGEFLITEYHKSEDNIFFRRINELFEAMARLGEVSRDESFKCTANKFAVLSALYSVFSAIIEMKLYSSVSISELPKDKNLSKLKSVLSFIRSNYDKPITLSDMASVASMSPKYFCHFFKSMTRKTPVDYLVAYRVEKASRKLLANDMSVTEIAYASGFNDLSYFIKTFKKLKGQTPAAFRKN